MKPLVIFLLFSLLISSRLTNAQIITTDLDQDPVFRQVATHRIHYPVKPASRAVYGRFYVGFTLDSLGHILNIAVLYPKMSMRVSFEQEIINGLSKMPPLKPALAGNYLLPVAFCFTHYREGPSPLIPTNTLPASLVTTDRIGLHEVRIYASSPSAGDQLRGFPASRQIGQP